VKKKVHPPREIQGIITSDSDPSPEEARHQAKLREQLRVETAMENDQTGEENFCVSEDDLSLEKISQDLVRASLFFNPSVTKSIVIPEKNSSDSDLSVNRKVRGFSAETPTPSWRAVGKDSKDLLVPESPSAEKKLKRNSMIDIENILELDGRYVQPQRACKVASLRATGSPIKTRDWEGPSGMASSLAVPLSQPNLTAAVSTNCAASMASMPPGMDRPSTKKSRALVEDRRRDDRFFPILSPRRNSVPSEPSPMRVYPSKSVDMGASHISSPSKLFLNRTKWKKKDEKRLKTALYFNPNDYLYRAFEELLMERSAKLVDTMCAYCFENFQDGGEFLYDAVVRHLIGCNRIVPFLTRVFENQLELSKRETLLRENNLANVIMSKFLEVLGGEFLHKITENLMSTILSEPQPSNYEIDAARLPGVDNATIQENAHRLVDITSNFFEQIVKYASLLPLDVRKVLINIKRVVSERFGQSYGIVFGNIVFLRFICPAIVCPEALGYDTINMAHRRVLVLVSKLLQNLVNGVGMDGTKESYMLPCKHFVQNYKSSLEGLMNDLVDEEKVAALALAVTNVFLPPDSDTMAILRNFFVDNFEGIWPMLPVVEPLMRKIGPFVLAGLRSTQKH